MNTRIDFYLLQDPDMASRLQIACRLTEKAYLSNHKVYLYTPSPTDCEALDGQLWTFRDTSFIPHAMMHTASEPYPPVVIGYEAAPATQNDILINLTDTLPTFFQNFARVIEIIPQDEASKAKGRELYRKYREAGCELQTINI